MCFNVWFSIWRIESFMRTTNFTLVSCCLQWFFVNGSTSFFPCVNDNRTRRRVQIGLYVIYIFVGICSDWVCYGLFLCYVPLCKRYYDIHKGRDDLRSWWYVIAIRFIMALLTYKGLENRGCQLEDYPNYVSIFLESHSWL